MSEGYGVYSEFDIEKHKAAFVNYLEVCIEKDGSIHYAVPSHMEYAIKRFCANRGLTRTEMLRLVPAEYYFDMTTWLNEQTGIVFVWNDWYLGDEMTTAQYIALRKLKMSGLYKGAIPGRKING